MSVFEFILVSQRFNIHQVNPSLAKDVLRPTTPTQSRALTLAISSLYLRGLCYTVQRANNLPLHSNFVMPHLKQNAYHYLKEKCSKIHLGRKKNKKQRTQATLQVLGSHGKLRDISKFFIPKKVISTGKHVCTSPRSEELERKRNK